MIRKDILIRTMAAALIYDIGVHRRNVARHNRLMKAYSELVDCHHALTERHTTTLAEYEQALTQRNYLMRKLNDSGIHLDEFDLIALHANMPDS